MKSNICINLALKQGFTHVRTTIEHIPFTLFVEWRKYLCRGSKIMLGEKHNKNNLFKIIKKQQKP